MRRKGHVIHMKFVRFDESTVDDFYAGDVLDESYNLLNYIGKIGCLKSDQFDNSARIERIACSPYETIHRLIHKICG